MSNAAAIGLAAYLITLKIKNPTLYARIAKNEVSAHQEAIDWLSTLIRVKDPDAMVFPDFYYKSLQELHQLQLGDEQPKNTPCLSKHPDLLFGQTAFLINRERAFAYIFDRIDLPVEM